MMNDSHTAVLGSFSRRKLRTIVTHKRSHPQNHDVQERLPALRAYK